MENLENVVKAAAAASDKPSVVTAVQKEDGFRDAARNLSGPAISVMLMAVIGILTWGIKLGLWTAQSEMIRAHYVGGIGVALALMLGIVIWILNGGRPTRLEVKVGPSQLTLESNGKPSDE